MASGLSTAAVGSTSTIDGILRNHEVVPEFLGEQVWDGRGTFSYIPPPAPELRISQTLTLHTDFDLDFDPFTYQVLRNRFWSINLDHSDTIRRVSGSPVIVYMDDFNTALLTETADLFMCGPSIQWFAALGDLPIKWTLENRSTNPGIKDDDVFMTNDPYIGCTHQMDIGMFSPVFWEGRLFSWAFSQCHVGDVGGPMPGSFNPLAQTVYEEPALMPPVKLVRQGELQQDILEMHLRKSRTPELLALQLRSQIAGLRTVRHRMLELLHEYGPSVVKGAMRRMIRDSSQAIGKRLEQIPDGEWRERTYMGGLGPNDRNAHRFEITLRKTGDRMTFSNAGTDPQFYAGNATYSTWRSGIIVAVTNFLGWDQLLCNAGGLDHITLEPTPGTLCCAQYPGATTSVGGTNASVYGGGYVVSKMLLSGPPELRARANGAGGQSVVSFWFAAGLDRKGKFLAEAPGDCMAGSIGAFPGRDGVDAGGAWWWPNNTTGNAEDWEAALPILYLYRREQPGGGGAGMYRGGNSIETGLVAHKTDQLTVNIVSIENSVNCAIGVSGGLPGHPGRYLRATGVDVRARMAAGWLPATEAEAREAMPGALHRLNVKEPAVLSPDDVFFAAYCGGGGYGDPISRDPAVVEADVLSDLIDAETARRHYGVEVLASGGIDPLETDRLRAEIRAERLAAATYGRAVSDHRLEAVQGLVAQGVAYGVGEDRDQVVWGCAGCGHVLGPVQSDYKLGTATVDRPPQDVDPNLYPDPHDATDVEMVIRQHICPSCAALLSTEFCRADEPPFWDVRLNAHQGENGKVE